MNALTTSEEAEDEPGKNVDKAKIKSKLHYYLRTCSAAVRKAKTFEVQRTVKRLKTSKEEEGSDSLQRQLEAIKLSDHGQLAALAIRSKLVKAKLLPKSQVGDDDTIPVVDKYPLLELIQELQGLIGSNVGMEEVNTDEGKAKARLLSNKVVSEEVSKAVKDLSILLGHQSIGGGESVVMSGKQIRASDAPRKLTIAEKEDSDEDTAEALDFHDDIPSEDDVKNDLRDKVASRAPRKSEPIGEKAPSLLKITAKRPASGSDDEKIERSRKLTRVDKKIAREDSEEESGISDGGESSDDDEEDSSAHLPALSTGFVAGKGLRLGRASDDEWSDGDADLESIDEEADETGRKKESKKNRMGQRARRAIWEKKFGKQANHIKLLEKEPRKVTRGAQGQFKVVRGQARPPKSDTGWNLTAGRPSITPTAASVSIVTKAKTEEEMHPSWIAKQKQKERAEAALKSGGTAKKIVFD